MQVWFLGIQHTGSVRPMDDIPEVRLSNPTKTLPLVQMMHDYASSRHLIKFLLRQANAPTTCATRNTRNKPPQNYISLAVQNDTQNPTTP
jgi:hypothetical protein